MTSVRLRAPRRVRIGRGPVPWQRSTALRITHVGQSAVLLRDRHGEHVVLSDDVRGLVPGGVCLPEAGALAAVRRQLQPVVAAAGGVVDLTGWAAAPPDEVDVVDLTLVTTPVDPAAVARMRSCLVTDLRPQVPRASRTPRAIMDPRPLRALATPLAHAARSGSGSRITTLLTRLVGAGPGATPSGDDVVVGALAALAASPAPAARRSAERITRQLPALLPRTTAASAHDLRAAATGQFGEHVHHLVAALADPDQVAPAVSCARTWGATSGIDLACGILASAQVMLSPPTSHAAPHVAAHAADHLPPIRSSRRSA